MFRARISLCLALLCTSLHGGAAEAQPATTSEASRKADELYKRGTDAYQAKQMEQAYPLLKEAFALKQTYDIAGNLGVVELELGKHRDAAEHLAFTIRTYPATGDKERKKRAEEFLETAKSKVGTLNVRCNLPGAAIRVDGTHVGTTPLADEVFLEPGRRTIVASRAEYESVSQTIEIRVGGTDTVELVLKPSSIGSGGADGGSGGSGGEARPIWPAFLMGGIGVAGLGVGVGFTVASIGADSDAQGVADSLAGKTTDFDCEADGPCTVQRGQELAETKATFSGVGIVGLVAAGTAAIGTIVYLALPEERSKSTLVLPVLSPTTVGASLLHSF